MRWAAGAARSYDDLATKGDGLVTVLKGAAEDHVNPGEECAHEAAALAHDHHHGEHDHHNTHDRGAHADHDVPGGHAGHAGHDHGQMVADFKKRLWTCLFLTIPVLALSPMIQHALGLGEQWRFNGDVYILSALSSVIYFYGGWPFLDGLRQEISARNPGMMTLIGVAITAAYMYSVATVIGLPGNDFFWELVTLIDIMLFGHWIEMKSVMGAGKALEALAALIPDTAHLLNADGSIQDIAVNTLKGGEHLLVKPGEKIPADSIIIKGETWPMSRC